MAAAWLLVLAGALAVTGASSAATTAGVEPGTLTVTAPEYRLRFGRDSFSLRIELRDSGGHWRSVTREHTEPEFAFVDAAGVHSSAGGQALVRHEAAGGRVAVGVTLLLSTAPPAVARLHFICVDEGVLIRFSLPDDRRGEKAVCWALPRLLLAEPLFDAYTFWRDPDELRAGQAAGLGQQQGYAGVSAWGQEGDTARRLSARHPALLALGARAGVGLGEVLMGYGTDWTGAASFLQRHDRSNLFFYPGVAPASSAAKGLWAWLAPFPASGDASKSGPEAAAKVERLLGLGETLIGEFRPLAPEPDAEWTQPLPDFPAELRRAKPVADIREAAVYTMNESIESEDGLALARKAGSDVLIRAWFKWRNEPDRAKLAPLVPPAHALGALFGGGITCSALYEGENGLTQAQVLDMATRGPDGQLVDAWGEARCRHGSLSSPAYREYLLSWCRRQIDAGADYLFMDEHTAALQPNEGFDDYSMRDFRDFLARRYVTGKGWARDDQRWHDVLRIDFSDRAVCPNGTLDSFDGRAWLAKQGLTSSPHGDKNPLAPDWHAFRQERDDQEWKWLTDAIHAYGRTKDRQVLISANGLAHYVDFQVLGVWDSWRVKDGAVDLAENQIQEWAATVQAGWALAGRKVPVVYFHDWGFGGFPWMQVTPADRRLWMRVRGAEIYAAGGFFAFPVHGPFNNDASRDGTLREVARQAAFYQRNKALYLNTRLIGFEPLTASGPLLSLALWRRDDPPALLLHAVNRQVKDGKPARRQDLAIQLPTVSIPKSVRIVSPDWEGERPGRAVGAGPTVTVSIPELDAYAVALLDYDTVPELSMSERRIIPGKRWERPEKNEFVVEKGGGVRDSWALNGYLQGRLHSQLRNPPTFLVNLPKGGAIQVHVRAVATQGAKLECLVDSQLVKAIELPDRDGKNDSSAREYDETFAFPIPPGKHRVTVQNTGGDWMTVDWYAFEGETGEP
ncbi:MAG: hypothetical protein ABSE73_19600 [Planctomycetota bacterium]